jgi:hypothetical protein
MVMSTKNLARTVIEGGRAGFNKWERRHSNGQHRAAEREAFTRLGNEQSHDFVAPARKKVGRGFDDKLGAPLRWLERQVGRPWDLVLHDLLERFDPRTTAGRHIVFDHMLPWVKASDPCSAACAKFDVDRHGLLRSRPHGPRFSDWRGEEPLPRDRLELERWLDGRRVGARGDVLFWFTPTPGGGYRQHRRLDAGDAVLWRSLPEWFRERTDPAAPPALPPQNRN